MEIVAFCVVLVIAMGWTTFLLYFYARKDTPAIAYVMTFIGWFFGFMLLGILPYDIYLMLSKKDDEYNILKNLWTSLYWLSFILCWVILPILTSYLDSVEYTIKGKLCDAIKVNAIFYSLAGAGLVVFIIIYSIVTEGLDFADILGFGMALASAWALIQIILFMSNGLIDVPRDLWRKSDTHRRYRVVCCKLMQAQEIISDDIIEIESWIKKLQAIELVVNGSNQDYISKIYEEIPEDLTSFRSLTGAIEPDLSIGSSQSSARSKIKDYHYKIRTTLHEYSLHKFQYDQLVNEGAFLEDLLISKRTNQSYILNQVESIPETGKERCYQRLRLIWHGTLAPILYIVLSLFCFLFAIVIIFGEVSLLHSSLNMYLSALRHLIQVVKNSFIGIFLTTILSLCMIILYAYYGIFNFRLAKFYGLFPHKQTDPSALVYSALQTAKLSFPICYNYLLLLSLLTPEDDYKTSFERVMGNINVIPALGPEFQKYFPCVIFLFLILNFFELFSALMKALHLENFAFILDISFNKFDQGVVLLHQERKKSKDYRSQSDLLQAINAGNSSLLQSPLPKKKVSPNNSGIHSNKTKKIGVKKSNSSSKSTSKNTPLLKK